jgi:hypothetical protein
MSPWELTPKQLTQASLSDQFGRAQVVGWAWLGSIGGCGLPDRSGFQPFVGGSVWPDWNKRVTYFSSTDILSQNIRGNPIDVQEQQPSFYGLDQEGVWMVSVGVGPNAGEANKRIQYEHRHSHTYTNTSHQHTHTHSNPHPCSHSPHSHTLKIIE